MFPVVKSVDNTKTEKWRSSCKNIKEHKQKYFSDKIVVSGLGKQVEKWVKSCFFCLFLSDEIRYIGNFDGSKHIFKN